MSKKPDLNKDLSKIRFHKKVCNIFDELYLHPKKSQELSLNLIVEINEFDKEVEKRTLQEISDFVKTLKYDFAKWHKLEMRLEKRIKGLE